VLYLIIIIIGALGEVVVRGGLIVSGDAAATAEKIRSSEFLWRVGIAAELFPSLAHRLFPAVLLPAFVGEASLCLWLLVKGVNLQRWNEQAIAAT
jgi:Domain of unknown function (DUF4386)